MDKTPFLWGNRKAKFALETRESNIPGYFPTKMGSPRLCYYSFVPGSVLTN
jgi:hypothetical protein